MGTMIVVHRMNRDVTPDVFADITPSTFTYRVNDVGETEFVFDMDLNPGQVNRISKRASLVPNQEKMLNSVGDILDQLRTVRDSNTTLTPVQLSAAVRAIAGAQIIQIRLAVQDYSGTD